MATLIIDNGEDYSGHRIWFVAGPPEHVAWLDAHIAANALLGDRARVIAVAESFEWRSGRSLTVDEVLEQLRWKCPCADYWHFGFDTDCGYPAKHLRPAPP